jgi:hypothetical protein
MEWRTVRTIFSLDGARRLRIVRSDDGLYSFTQEERCEARDGSSAWTPVWPMDHSICDTADTAEREARSSIDWLRSSSA